MIRSILFSLVLFLLGQGRISNTLLICLCLVPIVLSVVFKKDHHHSSLQIIENLSNHSALGRIHPGPKLIFAVSLIIFLVALKSMAISAIVLLCSIGFFLKFGRPSLHSYLDLMTGPLIFILMSTIGIILSVAKNPTSPTALKIFNLYFSISPESQIQAIRLSLVSLASVSSLINLAITTPIGDVIYFMRKIKCPKVFIEITYLIYRYIFTLSKLLASMQNSANSRLGFVSYKRSLETAKMIANRLFNKSMRMALNSYSAMESRLYDGDINFLERTYARSIFSYLAGGFFAFLILIYLLVIKWLRQF